jgi:hypothetical protein
MHLARISLSMVFSLNQLPNLELERNSADIPASFPSVSFMQSAACSFWTGTD